MNIPLSVATIAAVAVLPFLFSAAVNAQVNITSFENATDIKYKTSGTKALYTTEYVTDGGQALQVEFQKNMAWPKIEFTPADGIPWNWTDSKLTIDISNPSDAPVNFSVRVDDDPSADGNIHCRTGSGSIEPRTSITFVMPIGQNAMDFGMRGLPPSGSGREIPAGGSGAFNPGHIVAFQVFMSSPRSNQTIVLDNLRLVPTVDLKGIVDKWGQYAKADWPGKIKSSAELPAQWKAEVADIKKSPTLPDRDRFGGWASGPKLKAAGYFRTEQVDGKWWFVDPDGKLFLSFGVDCVGEGNDTIITGREYMFNWLPGPAESAAQHFGVVSSVHSGPVSSGQTYDFLSSNLERKYGPLYLEEWSKMSLKRLPSWGFNTIGNWSSTDFYKNGKVPYTATAGIGGDHARVPSGTDYWGLMHDPFDPQFAADVETSLEGVVAAVKGDPWCIGYFVDNELSWGGTGSDKERCGLALGSLEQDASSPAKQALLKQLKAKYATIDQLNTAWKTKFADWAALDPPYKHTKTMSASMIKDLTAFVKSFALQYFTVVRDTLKTLDPNHLYLGCRLAWSTQEVIDAAAEICDVVSFNIYQPKVTGYDFMAKIGKPCIIGEFHFGALDRGMFHTGLVAAPDQVTRAKMYEEYVNSVVDNPALVGCHWFRYSDEPLTGRSYDGENYNIGLVSITDTPYPELIGAAKKVHSEAYTRRYSGVSK